MENLEMMVQEATLNKQHGGTRLSHIPLRGVPTE